MQAAPLRPGLWQGELGAVACFLSCVPLCGFTLGCGGHGPKQKANVSPE